MAMGGGFRQNLGTELKLYLGSTAVQDPQLNQYHICRTKSG